MTDWDLRSDEIWDFRFEIERLRMKWIGWLIPHTHKLAQCQLLFNLCVKPNKRAEGWNEMKERVCKKILPSVKECVVLCCCVGFWDYSTKMSTWHFYCIKKSRQEKAQIVSVLFTREAHKPLCEVMSQFYPIFWFPPIFLRSIQRYTPTTLKFQLFCCF